MWKERKEKKNCHDLLGWVRDVEMWHWRGKNIHTRLWFIFHKTFIFTSVKYEWKKRKLIYIIICIILLFKLKKGRQFGRLRDQKFCSLCLWKNFRWFKNLKKLEIKLFRIFTLFVELFLMTLKSLEKAWNKASQNFHFAWGTLFDDFKKLRKNLEKDFAYKIFVHFVFVDFFSWIKPFLYFFRRLLQVSFNKKSSAKFQTERKKRRSYENMKPLK